MNKSLWLALLTGALTLWNSGIAQTKGLDCTQYTWERAQKCMELIERQNKLDPVGATLKNTEDNFKKARKDTEDIERMMKQLEEMNPAYRD